MASGSPADPAATAAPEGRAGSRLGVWLALVGTLLAVAVVSTPTRQGAVWAHLARGRAAATGSPPPDRNPALIAPAGDPSAHQSPLYDATLFAAVRLLGGAGVPALTAAAAAALALVVFRAGRTAGGSAPAGLGAVLTVLGLAPWLEASPRLVSYLLLALTVVLLRAATDPTAPRAALGRARWATVAVVAVWANVDRWVVLGPVAVAGVALGEWGQGRGRAARGLGWVFVAALAASLVGPDRVGVWAFAPAGGESAPGLPDSPFWPGWYRTSPAAVGGAYVVLAAAGLAAFVRDGGRRARPWLPLWSALLGWAACAPAGAPFFAVVAGPVAAVGLSGRRRPVVGPGTDRPRWVVRQVRLGGGVLAYSAPAVVLAAGGGGWVTGPPYGRPSWSLAVDESLRDAASDVARSRRAGLLAPDARGLTLSPEVADYWSWFGAGGSQQPGRPAPDSDVDVARLEAGLLNQSGSGAPPGAEWRQVLRARKVDHLVLHLGGNPRVGQVVTRLAGSPDEWPLLYLRGQTAVFGWRDPLARPARAGYPAESSIDRRAFLPGEDDRAPPDGAGRGPGEGPWWRPFVEPLAVAPPDQGEAALYTAYFDGHRGLYEARARAAWLAAQGARLAGHLAAAPSTGAFAAAVGQWASGAGEDWASFRARQPDEGPLGAALLAVRAARRAVRAAPDDARGYFLLGEAYWRLSRATRERAWAFQLPAFDRIRQVQAIVAFQRVLVLRPDSPAAHGRLARIYRDRGSLDLALYHLGRLAAVVEARGPLPGEDAEAARASLAALERERDDLAAVVRQRQEALGAGPESRRLLDRAREAAGAGLPNRALDLLLASDASEFGPEGVRLELDLLLWSGRVRDLRSWLDPSLERSVGAVTYHEVRACLAAACGEYGEAGREMGGVAAALMAVPSRLSTPPAQASYDVVRGLLAVPLAGGNPAGSTHQALVRQGLLVEVQQINSSVGREANALVVAGLLALEAGEVERAAESLRTALGRCRSPDAGAGAFGIDFAGRAVAEDCLSLIAAGRAGR